MGIVNSTLGGIKAELKPAKIIAFIVMLIIAGFILNWLSSKSAAVAKVNPLGAK